jgi:hypothetical protein
MTGPSGTDPPHEAPREPQIRLRKRRSETVEPQIRPGDFVPWLQWIQEQPVLAIAVLVFCLTAVGGLLLSLPQGLLSAGRSTQQEPVRAPDPPPAAAPAEPAPAPAPAAEPAAPNSWVVKPASPASRRGLALVYAYRELPPGSDSRFEWYVQIQGPRALLDEVDHVRWRMDPPPKNDGGDLVSRDRAEDGFPLFGGGPGGWFRVSATVQFKDGSEDTLSRRIELPE